MSIEKFGLAIVTSDKPDLPEIWSVPLPLVINILKRGKTYLEVANSFLDIALISINQKIS